MKDAAKKSAIVELPVTLIDGDQTHPTRLNLGCLKDLTTSVRHSGILTPVTVTKNGDRYTLVDGFRRLKVAKDLGIESVLCVVYEDLNEAVVIELSYTLNTKQNPLNTIEKVLVLKRLKEDHGYTNEELEILGFGSKGQISKDLSLLEQPQELIDAVASGKLSKSVALELKKLKDPEQIKKATKLAIANEWSQRKAKSTVERINRKAKKGQKKEVPASIPDQDVPGVHFCDSKDMGDYVPDGSAALVFTSPGYLNGAEYENGYNDDELLDNIRAILGASAKAVMPGGFIVLNVGNVTNYRGKDGKEKVARIKPMLHFYETCLRKPGFHLQDEIVWAKDFNSFTQDDAVNYTDDTPHTGYRIVNRHEFIYVFKKKGEREIPTDEDIILRSRISRTQWKVYAPSVWKISPAPKGQGHPNIFPDELARRIIKMFTFVGDTVVDPCLGSGTTVKVAKELGRDAVGFERDLRYKALIMKRLGVAEEKDAPEYETVTELVRREREEFEANQPAGKRVEVEMSEDMADDVAEITENHEKELAHA